MNIALQITIDAIPPPETRAQNSYDFVRFCAASAVIFSHHFDLAGFPEPQVPGYGGDFGELGVEIFFALSGFLICLSLQRSQGLIRFAAARILRIFPNLVFVLLITSTATFVWYHNDANIGAHIRYITGNLLLFGKGVTQVIPGVFEDAVRPAVNEPLWTLPYELWLYVLLALIFLLGNRLRSACIVFAALLLSALWGANDIVGEFTIGALESFEFSRLGSFFLSGAMLAVFWTYIKKYSIAIGTAGLIGVFLVRNLLPIDTIFLPLTLAAGTIGLASSRVIAWFSKGGDASYGMYIFAWPVQQLALLLIASFWLSMLVAFALTVALGYGTWHAFEKRIIAYPERLREIVRRPVLSENHIRRYW